MSFEDLIEQTHTEVNQWRKRKGLAPHPFNSPYGKNHPAIIKVLSAVAEGEVMAAKTIPNPGYVEYKPGIIDARGFVAEQEGVEGVKDFLTEMELNPVKEEDMATVEETRVSVLNAFATPQPPSVVLADLEKATGLSKARGYYYLAQLRKEGALVAAGKGKSSNGMLLPMYVATPKKRGVVTIDATPKQKVSAKVAAKVATPANKSHHKKASAPPRPASVEAEVSLKGPVVSAPKIVHPPAFNTSAVELQEKPNGSVHSLCSALAHQLLDVDLGQRTLSADELLAMRHLQKMLEDKTVVDSTMETIDLLNQPSQS